MNTLSLLLDATSVATTMTTAGVKGAADVVTAEEVQLVSLTAHNVWMMIATALVFIMHLGFAGVESGFTQAKNTVNILFKNTLTFAIGLLSYAFVGFKLMYPTVEDPNGFFNWSGIGIGMAADYVSTAYADGHYTYWTDFLFQGMFAATCATIVSGAVAERIRISAYLIFTVVFVGIVYPAVGMWHWGGGWLSSFKIGEASGFIDFAGSTLVHSVGGWGALAGVILLGAREGKYVDGKVVDKPGSSVPLATIGVFLLWLGWFGFNGGSVLSADPEGTSLVLVTTCLAGAAGAIGGYLFGYIAFKRLDLGMVLNGVLAGLVGITAGADIMSPLESVGIGLFCGSVAVMASIGLDKLKLDDCVGAIPVHLVCGIIGTLACGVLGSAASVDQFLIQLVGVVSYAVVCFPVAFLIFFVLKKTRGIRVSREHEIEGMDSYEHGVRGYMITYDE